MDSIRQIVYSSVETTPFDRLRLVSLLNSARASNLQRGITGVLLHVPGQFVQCLEGEPQAVGDLYDKISTDKRHQSICLLQDLTLPTRYFQNWTMGCAQIKQSEYLRLRTAEWEAVAAGPSPEGWQSPGFALMKALWNVRKDQGL